MLQSCRKALISNFTRGFFFFQKKKIPSGELKKSRFCKPETCIKLLRKVKVEEKIIEILLIFSNVEIFW